MFAEIGNKYIALQMATYGTDHIYQCDTYVPHCNLAIVSADLGI